MIRMIHEDDAASVAKICKESLGHDTSEELLKSRISELKNEPFYYIRVYEDDAEHKVRGFIQAQKYDLLYGGSGWNIIALAVAEEFQHKGIGKDLLHSLEIFVCENGSSFLRLNSRMERNDAHGFYKHLGFQCDKIQKRFIKYLN